jgi:hypothetical protein
MRAYGGSGCIDPCILDLSTASKRLTIFKSRPFCLRRGKNPLVPTGYYGSGRAKETFRICTYVCILIQRPYLNWHAISKSNCFIMESANAYVYSLSSRAYLNILNFPVEIFRYSLMQHRIKIIYESWSHFSNLIDNMALVFLASYLYLNSEHPAVLRAAIGLTFRSKYRSTHFGRGSHYNSQFYFSY